MVKSEKQNRITTRLFAGFELTAEIKMQLAQSNEWKQTSVAKDFTNDPMIECPYHGKVYLGRYLDSSILTLQELRNHAKSIGQTLSTYCPELDTDKYSLHFFPIVFVT